MGLTAGIEAVVFAKTRDGAYFYVADESSLNGWNSLKIDNRTAMARIEIGDKLTLSGEISETAGETCLVLATASVATRSNIPTPYEITTGTLANSEAYEACFVRVNEPQLSIGAFLRLDDGSGACIVSNELSDYIINDTQEINYVQGVAGTMGNEHTMMCRSEFDVDYRTPTSDVLAVPSATIVYPNPFNPQKGMLRIENELAKEINIFNIRGQRVARIDGHPNFSWDGKSESGANCPSGVYFIKANKTNSRQQKVLIIR